MYIFSRDTGNPAEAPGRAAQALLLQNWIAGPASLVALLPLDLVRVPQEERMMLRHFGDEDRRYGERTGRIFPRLR
ncbi:hypothetical protein [Symbiobacterium terraclitae]|uniref:hypothetical protein n=1 Tax=Symbiobacterium terraclitae TaxID=557451 RepID=UPI0035B5368B